MAINSLSEKYDIYLTSFDGLEFETLYSLYADLIMPEVRTCAVVSALTEYVTRVIEPVGWSAVWKTPKHKTEFHDFLCPTDCELLVEVRDVSMKKLQASVDILDILRCSDGQLINCQNMIGQKEVDVPLVQLYPIRDKEEMFLGTAQAIHTVRFFYDNIWRPWDDEDDEENFVEKHLSTRLKFYFQRVKGLPEAVECRCHELISEATEIILSLEKLESQMSSSDSEDELDEEDVRKCMQLRIRLESLQKEMEILENPLLRILMSKKHLTQKHIQRDETAVLVVSPRLTLGMVKGLVLEDDSVLEMHSKVEEALSAALSGDTILIFPGHYKLGNIPWLEESITIQGLGKEHEVILEAAEGTGDLFLSCNAQSLTLENLVLVPSCGMLATIMVHRGELNINRCKLNGAKNALVVLQGGQAQLNNCLIENSQGDGIQLRSGSRCSLQCSCIQNCQGTALKVDTKSHTNDELTNLILTKSKLINNQHFGLLIDCLQMEGFDLQDVTWENLKSIPFLELTVDSVEIEGNGKGDLGLCSDSAKIKEVSPLSASDSYSSTLCSNFPKLTFPQLSDSEEY